MSFRQVSPIVAAAIGIAAAMVSAQTPSPNVRPSGGRPGCKAYPASATMVNVSSGVRTEQRHTNRFDPRTNEFVTDLTYSNSNGIRFSDRAVHYYESTADFVNEVKTIPPLKLYKRVVFTGATPMTSVNTYDDQRRLVRFVTTTLQDNAQSTMTYSRWDQVGRPTAGVQTGPSGRMTVAIAYDDQARTMTTTNTPTGGVQSVARDTFDANGNIMRTDWTVPNQTSTTTYQLESMTMTCIGGIERPMVLPK